MTLENSDDDLAGEPDEEKPRTFAATARMFKLRRNLYQLDNFQRQKERSLLKAREDLNLLRQSIETLLEQRDVLEQEIKHQEAAENSVAVIRLRAQHKNVCYELQREEEIEAHTNNELRQQELALSEFELEVGKFSVLRQEVQEEERVYHVLKAQNAVKRLEQEKNNSHTLRRKIQQLKKKNVDVPEKPDTLVRKKSEDGGANREKGAKYLKETIRRMQQQEAEREQKKRESMQKRIEAVKLLKSNIEATQENLRVRQSRAKANTLKKERQEKRLKESMHAQGLNSTRHIYQQKRDEEVKRQQEEFKERQKARRVEIVDKLLEEQLVKNRKARQAPQPKTKPGQKILSPGRIKERLLRYLDSLRKLSASGSSSDSEYQEDIIEKEMQHLSLPDSLEEPEFCGLWDQSYKLPLNEKKTAAVVCPKLRKTPKKGVGKQIKGPSFTSKPEVILFKDFEVGETYKKKVILTNISNITNHCKFLEISAQLQDFIIINFQPPGPLSTGMSCEMHITFHPSINEDLEGEVAFASAESNFFVAVKCTIKRCDLEVDSQFIDFGSHVVGQTILRTITLTNKGALATRFSLDTTKPVPEIHQVQIPSHCSADTQQCKINYSCDDGGQDTPCADQNQSAASIPTSMDHVLDRSTVSRQCQRESQISTSDPRAASVASSIHSQIQDGLSDSCDIRIGNVREGDIGPFESVKLEIIFSPTVPGEVKLDLYIKFSDPTSYPIAILVKGEGVGLPVWVVEPNIDMKICMFDRLYQEEVTLQSSTSTALKLTFDLWPEMRKHMEIIPRTGFLQAQSSFTAHLKFLPRNTLPEDADKYFDSATGVLEVPMAVQVAGQVQPVIYTVQAIVTSSDLNFDQSEVDFGYCSIYQSVKSSVRMTNMSLLPQEFGFVGLPEFVDVQPNDGFGTLLPQETLEVDIIFSANKAKEYRFSLNCKSGINRVFPLACRAMGVCPTLALSHSLVQFGPTAVGDHSTALLYLTYNQTVRNQSKQRPSAGARLFSFTSPQDSSIRITPAAGRLLPGKRCLVLVTFKPKLEDRDIKEEAQRLLLKAKKTNEEDSKKLLEEQIPVVGRAQKRLHFLRVLKKNHLEQKLLVSFDRAAVESILHHVWYAGCTAADRKSLQRAINTAQKIISCPLPCLEEIASSRYQKELIKSLRTLIIPATTSLTCCPPADATECHSGQKHLLHSHHQHRAPQGCVLSPLLYTLYTHDCSASSTSNLIVKFADDTTVLGLISNDDETDYRREVQHLESWCHKNNLALNTKKTKEIVVDFRKGSHIIHQPLTIGNDVVEKVRSFKFLGVTVTEDLSWGDHISTAVGKAQQRLYYLRKLKSTNIPRPLMADQQALQRVVKAVGRIIGMTLPEISTIYSTRCLRRVHNILRDQHHPAHNLFHLLPSGRRGQRFEEARASLLHSFTSRYNEYTIPCFVSDGDPPEEDRQAQPAWSPLNTLYLKLQCPAVQPPLVVVSSNIRNYALDFQQVAVGERVIKRFSVQNISEESLELRSSLLDIYGPFLLLNALRAIGPGEKHTLALAFCPTLEKKYCETLEVRCHKMTLAVTLRGEGVVPAITSSHSGGLLDFGYVLEKESTSHVLKLQNSSTVAVGFKAMLYSLTPSETRGPDERVAILLGGYTDSKIQPVVGTQNYNGLSVFSVLPVEGSIAAKQSQDVIVTFHPDHPSVNYSDQLTIELVNKSKLCVLDLKGAASSHNMYLQGGDQLAVPIESLLPPPITSQQGPSEDTDIPVLVTLRASYSMGTIRPAVRELQLE
nr:cilia- and flagella-associated protein 74-like [Nerophis lumbriciformis]